MGGSVACRGRREGSFYKGSAACRAVHRGSAARRLGTEAAPPAGSLLGGSAASRWKKVHPVHNREAARGIASVDRLVLLRTPGAYVVYVIYCNL